MAPRSHAEVLPTHTAALFKKAVREAVEQLRRGQVVALPTETVYGLAANAFDPEAVAKIFAIKGRPANNPIIVHVASASLAERCVTHWPPLAEKLARAFWPGPLTIVLPRSEKIPDLVTGGGSTVGVRWPSHPFIQAVIRECDFPLAAPSANPSNRLSPTNAEHVAKSLGDKISLIVDGGQSQIGIESTVVDLSTSPPRLLRPGMVHEQAIAAVIGELKLDGPGDSPILKSPGQLPKHYSPRARLVILSWKNDQELETLTTKYGVKHERLHIICYERIPSPAKFGRVSVVPHDPEAFARALYAELHECDEAGAELIIVEGLPETGEWAALRDRLKRASAPE